MYSHWHDDWADLASVPEAVHHWAHHGLAVTSTGECVGFNAGRLVFFGPDGHVRRLVETGLSEGHGITAVIEEGEDLLWVADPGFTIVQEVGGNLGHGLSMKGAGPRVVKVSLNGEVRAELARPPMDEGQSYVPTWVAVDERRLDGTGDIWLADGYGSSLVHRFDEHGVHRATLTGVEGGGRFDCPHAIFIDRRGSKRELYIADRGNARIQVYDLEGRYLRTVGDGVLTSPSAFAVVGDQLIVAELRARLAVLDLEDRLVSFLGENAGVPDRKGWPNSLDEEHNVVRSRDLVDGAFHSPHALAVDADGSLHVAEWLLGGRYTKLTP